MDRQQAIQDFVLSKTSIQMIEATLEESIVKKLHTPAMPANLHNDLNFGYKVNEISDNEISAYLKTTVTSATADGEPVLELEVTYRGRFIAEPYVDEIDFKNFAEIQTVPQLMPYARAFIASLTTHMGIEPIILPTMDIIQSMIENAASRDTEEND